MWWIHRRNGWPRRLACYTSRSMRCGTGLSHPWRYCRGLSDHVVGCFPSCADAAAVKPAGRGLEGRFGKTRALGGARIHERHSGHRVGPPRGGGGPVDGALAGSYRIDPHPTGNVRQREGQTGQWPRVCASTEARGCDGTAWSKSPALLSASPLPA